MAVTESNRNDYQQSYYEQNKEKIRTQRMKKKLDNPDFLNKVTLKSLEKYHLVDYAKSLGRDVKLIEVNKISYELSKTVNETIQKKVTSQLEAFDKEMKELIGAKKQQLINFKQGMPLTSGNFTLTPTARAFFSPVSFFNCESESLSHRRWSSLSALRVRQSMRIDLLFQEMYIQP
jgi:hypothetical protein